MSSGKTYVAIGSGAYQERENGKPTGRYAERPRGKTWRLLRGVHNKRDARKLTINRDPRTFGSKFAALRQRYLDAGCPDSNNEKRNDRYCKEEKSNCDWLGKFFDKKPLDQVGPADWPEYKNFRVHHMRKGCDGLRAVDKDRQTISNIFQFAVVNRIYPQNPFAVRYKHYHRPETIKHSRVRAPKTAEHIHQIAARLLSKVSTESTGWWTLFAMFARGRVSELLRFRMDAKQISIDPPKFEPGYIHTVPGEAENEAPRQFMQFGWRDKHGINPCVLIGPEFAEMLRAHRNWHRQRHPKEKYYFPAERVDGPIDRGIVHRQIARAAKRLGLHHITPHGYRSFGATKRRSDGENDARIAFEMGQKTVSVMQTHYADGPDNWMGGKKIGWVPEKGEPAWRIWLPEKREILKKTDFLLTDEKQDNAETANRINVAGVAKWQTHRT